MNEKIIKNLTNEKEYLKKYISENLSYINSSLDEEYYNLYQ